MPAHVSIRRTNTILYCGSWQECVAFYTDTLGLPVTFSNDWFVECDLGGNGHLSLADAARATVAAGGAASVTLSWQVPDVEAARAALSARGVRTGDLHRRWGASAFHIFDPEGHRIELWEEGAPERSRPS